MISSYLHKEKFLEFKKWKWSVISIIGMLMAALPAIFLAPYSINLFDEPYQIINAIDWETSIYSPLSSWLANQFGNLVGWKYLAFRYLALALNFTAIFICALYALYSSKRKKLIACSSIIIVLLALSFRLMSGYYGWDSWTACSLSICIVIFLSLIKRYTLFKLILLGVFTSVTALMRIPNISVIIFSVFILCFAFRKRKYLINRLLWFLSVFICTFFLILLLLVKNIDTYFYSFSCYHIGDHSLIQMVRPLLLRFILTLAYSCVFYISYKFLKYIRKSHPQLEKWSYLIIIGLFLLSLNPHKDVYFGMDLSFCLGWMLMMLIMLFFTAKYERDRLLLCRLFILFLFSLTAGIGSNGGYSKSLVWSLLPLIIWLFGDHFKGILKYLSFCSAIAYGIYSVMGILQYNYMDEKLSCLTYQFKDKESVLYGMYTTPERGEFISEIYEYMKQYIQKGYQPIVLRQGNDYIYEYIIMAPNKHQRHNFSNWYAFWDQEYVKAVQMEINESQQPVFVLYAQWKDTENPTTMWTMLQQNTKCMIDRPGYSIWIKNPSNH